MNAAVRARADLRRELTAARLATLHPVEGAGWLEVARDEARIRVLAMGLPQRRDEYWRFTDPSALIAPEPEAAEPEAAQALEADALRLTFRDGAFVPEESDDLALAGVEIDRLADVDGRADHWARGLYGALEAEGQAPVSRPLAALNTAFAPDGLLIRATARAARPVHVVHLQGSGASDAMLHHVVRVEPGASLTLLESGTPAARFSGVLEADVAEGGTFDHVRLQPPTAARALTHCFARLGTEARLRSFTLTVGGPLTRNEWVLRLAGDDAVAHLAGAAVADAGVHHDDTIFVTHDALRCESRQVFKKVLRNGATGVFQGKILVKKGAQKTDGYQLAQGLLLDESSQFLAKPELEIYADDVACSHGATAGALDEGALFYLRSRGVPAREAAALLTRSFLQGALDEIADAGLAEAVGDRLDAWLAPRP